MRRFLPFLLVLLVLAAVLRADFVFVVFYFLAAVYFLSRLWQGRMLLSLQVRRRFEMGREAVSVVERAFLGDQVTVQLSIHNSGWLPIPWLEIHESLPTELATPPFHRQVISLAAREERQLSYRLLCRYRGYYPIGPLRLRAGGLLGIHRADSVEGPADSLIVYPRLVPLEQLGLPTRSPLVALPARSPLFEDPSCVVGVRDYQYGDSPRRIHWTASASAGQLLVKQYRPSIARETLVLVDLDRDGYGRDYRFTAPELAITAAASVASHIVVRDGLPVGLSTEALDPLSGELCRFFQPPRPGRAHLMGVLDVLARVQVAPATPFAELIRQESIRLSWGATLVIIAGRESGELLNTLVYLRRTGFAVALILVQAEKSLPGFEERARQLNISVYRLWREPELRAGVGASWQRSWL